MDPEIEAGAQVQQLINVVCLQYFAQSPLIKISFAYTFVWALGAMDICHYIS